MKLSRFILIFSFGMLFSCQNNSKEKKQLQQTSVKKIDSTVENVAFQKQDSNVSKTILKNPSQFIISKHKKELTARKFHIVQNNISPQTDFNRQNISDSIQNPQRSNTDIKNEERAFLSKTAISPLIQKLKPASQTFTILNNRDTIIISKSGTSFAIGKNSFISLSGKIPHIVNITLLEVNSMADILNANLQTVSDDHILQTGGMFFIDAKENGISLEIANGKTIYVDLKTNYKDLKMKIFDGKFDHPDFINWTAAGELDNMLIAIPLNLLDFSKGGLECSLSEGQINLLNNRKYENTFIATREFEERATRVLNIAACENFKGLSQKLLDIYTTNIDKNIFYCDSLAADLVYSIYGKEIDTTKNFSFTDQGWASDFYKAFLYFKNEHLTRAINLDQIGVTQQTVTEDLISKGYSEMEATKIISYYKTQQELIKYRKSEKQVLKLASYSFSINKLGWKNVDQFLEGENLKNTDFAVRASAEELLDYISVSLVIPAYNVSIFFIHQDGNLYSFEKEKIRFRKLPVGQQAFLVAFSYKDGVPYFGKQKITIPENGSIDIILHKTTKENIKQEINSLMK